MRAAFESDLDVRKIGERRWLLLDDLRFRSVLYPGVFVAPRGFQTDLASIPQAAYTLFPPVGWYDYSAVIHDAGYGGALTTEDGTRIYATKDVADQLFLEGMEARDVPWMVRKLMYQAVRQFGNPAAHPLMRAHNASHYSEPA